MASASSLRSAYNQVDRVWVALRQCSVVANFCFLFFVNFYLLVKAITSVMG